ncbi:hypothetical protein KC340_g18575 [Hortaea werneckii]|nr:hypothetical protein KC342_g16685 [Hortaea werneckii]KAI7104219.1 hypothetical protein KC339_g4684 [Hortaea werneckii]KAI7206363.1 hypothetical protein KC365_g17201 [Hortaea werneckii]KAI7283305.1 hypothetical protein KC340_g18575 [Hortaea werneckii]KAI7374041.1 hypothetical protein KC328_g16242 [Hortaea werneckii]
MTNRASIIIYHSCDAPAAKVLHHFKKGTHKRPRSNQDIQLPPPTEKVFLPRRHGILETVLRCPLPNCKDCATTAYEGNELTLTVAKSHGITGVNLRPSRTAKTAAERLQDGLERGKWIFSREAMTSSTDVPDRTQRFATFHPQAASFARVLGFLRGVPPEVEVGDSTPQGENFFESSEIGSVDPSGLPLVDTMPVGAFHGDFGAPTATRDEGNTLGNQGSAHYRSSGELKPGQKLQGGDIVFPRLMPASLRGPMSLHHRQNVHTWPAADGTLERRPTNNIIIIIIIVRMEPLPPTTPNIFPISHPVSPPPPPQQQQPPIPPPPHSNVSLPAPEIRISSPHVPPQLWQTQRI